MASDVEHPNFQAEYTKWIALERTDIEESLVGLEQDTFPAADVAAIAAGGLLSYLTDLGLAPAELNKEFREIDDHEGDTTLIERIFEVRQERSLVIHRIAQALTDQRDVNRYIEQGADRAVAIARVVGDRDKEIRENVHRWVGIMEMIEAREAGRPPSTLRIVKDDE